MTDSELIKALENKVQGSDYACFEDYEILDLIKRQKSELEAIKDKKAMVFKLSEEQLNKVNENLLKSVEYNERKIKAEAYKEFADRIRQVIVLNNTHDGYLVHDIDYNCLMEDIDDVLKELGGDNK